MMDLIRIAFPAGRQTLLTLNDIRTALGAPPRVVAASIAAAVRWGFIEILVGSGGRIMYRNTR